MSTPRMISLTLLPLLAALVLASCDSGKTPTATEVSSDTDDPELGVQGQAEPFDEAQVFLEYNATANDMGFQLFLDAGGWRALKVVGPDGRVLTIRAGGPLEELGITELRFESEEPTPEEVLGLFPAGTYRFLGRTVDGEGLLSEPVLSHVLLAPPTFTPTEGQVVDPGNLVVTWNAPGAELVEVIIEDDEGHVFDVTVDGSVTGLSVPPQFLENDVTYKLEILAISPNGNRTIVEGTFVTEP
jgi:hypothetical protein